MVKRLPTLRDRRRRWHPTPVLLPRKSHGRRSLVGCSPWGRKELDTIERFHFQFSLSCIGEGNGNPLQCSCPENPRDGGAWWAAVYGVAQSWTRLKRLSSSSTLQETRVQSLGWEDLLEKEMATHPSIFAWKIPWMEEPGRLQSMGSQRVGHDFTFTFTLPVADVLAWRCTFVFTVHRFETMLIIVEMPFCDS